MPIFQGGTKITKIFNGSTPIKKVYQGNTLIWSAAQKKNFDTDERYTSGWGQKYFSGGTNSYIENGFYKVRSGSEIIWSGMSSPVEAGKFVEFGCYFDNWNSGNSNTIGMNFYLNGSYKFSFGLKVDTNGTLYFGYGYNEYNPVNSYLQQRTCYLGNLWKLRCDFTAPTLSTISASDGNGQYVSQNIDFSGVNQVGIYTNQTYPGWCTDYIETDLIEG